MSLPVFRSQSLGKALTAAFRKGFGGPVHFADVAGEELKEGLTGKWLVGGMLGAKEPAQTFEGQQFWGGPQTSSFFFQRTLKG